MLLINLNENKEKFFRLNIAKDPTIEFSREIQFDKSSQNKPIIVLTTTKIVITVPSITPPNIPPAESSGRIIEQPMAIKLKIKNHSFSYKLK